MKFLRDLQEFTIMLEGAPAIMLALFLVTVFFTLLIGLIKMVAR
jgi:hypothetical protein